MPYKKPTIEKIHYSIGEVAKMLNVTPSLLRYWEKEFSTYIKPFKNQKGNRYYTKKDIELIKYIYHLVKVKGLTIDGARQHLNQKEKDEIDKISQVISKLQQLKSELLDIKSKLYEFKNEPKK